MNFEQYEILINKTEKLLKLLNEKKANEPYAEGKWQRKMMLGHLIDSAINNSARIINAQHKQSYIFDGYDENFWVEHQQYNSASWNNLITLWYSFNSQIIHTISNVSDQLLTREVAEHNFNKICYIKLASDKPATLIYLIEDYFNHMEHHLEQIFS